MWRITYALISALMLTASFAATVLAEAHPAAPATSGGGGATTTTTAPVVTATPNTGVGTVAEQLPAVLLLTLVGLAGVFALLALAAARSERHA